MTLIISTTSDSGADATISGTSVAAETADGGGLSLREAHLLYMDAVQSGGGAPEVDGEIRFDASLIGATITLQNGELDFTFPDADPLANLPINIDGDVDGDGVSDIAISGGGASRLFSFGGVRTVGYMYEQQDAVLRNLTMIDGYTTDKGGAVLAGQYADVDVINSYLTQNEALSHGGAIAGVGGGLGSVNIVNTLLLDNRAGGDGGGAAINFGSVVNSSVDQNFADGDGGGVFGIDVRIHNSTVFGNVANGDGGGVFAQGEIVFSPFDGAVFGASSTIRNSIVAGNNANGLYDDVADSVASYFGAYYGLSLGDSFIGTAVTPETDLGGNIINGGDPMLGDLADNGGGVLTRSPLVGSPVIDAGDATNRFGDIADLDGDGDTFEDLPLDGRYADRVVGDDMDMGAVEFGACGVTLIGGPGDDELTGTICDDVLTGLGGDDFLYADLGDDIAYGGDGNDRVQGGAGDDSVYGGAGDDYVAAGIGEDFLDGGSGEDRMFGRDGNDSVFGRGDDDDIRGDDGSDFLQGGRGDDRIRGDKGFDKLQGSRGDDILEGGLGNDTFQIKTDWGVDTIADWGLGNDKMRWFGVDFEDLTITQSGADLIVSGPAGFGASFVLLNTMAADVSESDFIFT